MRENRRKLKIHYLKTLESSLDERKGTKLTVSKLKVDLIKNYLELDGISNFCIRDALRNRLSYSFISLGKHQSFRLRVGGSGCSTNSQRWCWAWFRIMLRQFSLMNFKVKAGFNSFYGSAERRFHGLINMFDFFFYSFFLWFNLFFFLIRIKFALIHYPFFCT